MKLQEFFDTQKQTSFTDVDKIDLYQNILYKKTKKASIRRFSFVHTKTFVYSMIFFVLLFGVYGLYFINNGSLQEYNRFSIIKNGTNTAQADYIAQVIDVEGNFFIEHDGVLSKTNNIGNGDTILLKEWAKLAFEIASGGTQSKIIGPAKLIIQKTHDENYKLNLIYGNFIQMEGNEWKTQTIELAVNDITIKQEDKSQPLNFKFVKNGDNNIFQNNGANIIVTKSNGEEKKTTISKQQVIAIQDNDIKVFANVDSFTKAIQEKNISQTFALATEETTPESGENKEEMSLLSLLSEVQQPTEVKEEITQEISSVLMDEKEILDPAQDEKVNANLSEGIYLSELKVLQDAFLEGNENAFNTIYAKVERRVQSIYQSFGMAFPKISGNHTEMMQWLKIAVQNLKNKINTEFNVPPTYIQSLENIEKSLATIIAKERGSNAPQEEIKTDTTTETITSEKIQE